MRGPKDRENKSSSLDRLKKTILYRVRGPSQFLKKKLRACLGRVFGEGVKSARGETAILGRGDHTRNMFGTSLHTTYCKQIIALETAEIMLVLRPLRAIASHELLHELLPQQTTIAATPLAESTSSPNSQLSMKIFHVGSHQYRESLRELLRELWFSYCSSPGKKELSTTTAAPKFWPTPRTLW